MTDTERAELKRLAEAATPGPWKHYTQTCGHKTVIGAGPHMLELCVADCDDEGLTKAQNAANGAFIAAANPVTVLDLLAENERLRHERYDALSVKTREGLLASEWVLRTGKAESERDALKAENERLKAFSRDGLKAFHGSACLMGVGAYPENPAECSDHKCREWAETITKESK